MNLVVAFRTNSDEILFGVVPERAARLDMMYLKVSLRTAGLAPPTIPLQDCAMERFV